MRTKKLPQDYALVLQQINEDGSDQFVDLVETLQFDRGRLIHILQALHNKGLVTADRSKQLHAWFSLSAKGEKLVAYLRPEFAMMSK